MSSEIIDGYKKEFLADTCRAVIIIKTNSILGIKFDERKIINGKYFVTSIYYPLCLLMTVDSVIGRIG